MRKSGARRPPGSSGIPRLASLGAVVVLCSAAAAVAAGVLDLFGAAAAERAPDIRVTATVSTAVRCDRPDARETVTFTVRGREHSAEFDGCGHAEGEPVEIVVPAGVDPSDDALVVQAASTVADTADTADAGDSGGPLAFVLVALSGVAGAGYLVLLWRGSRGTPLSRLSTVLGLAA